jgi:hypothetical protein
MPMLKTFLATTAARVTRPQFGNSQTHWVFLLGLSEGSPLGGPVGVSPWLWTWDVRVGSSEEVTHAVCVFPGVPGDGA